MTTDSSHARLPDAVLDRALTSAESVWTDALARVTASDLDRASGCDGWSVRDLINHVNGGGDRYAMLLAGTDAAATAATRDTDYIGDDALDTFWRHENALRDTAQRRDLAALVHHRVGPRSGAVLIQMRVIELSLHAKDLCDALGIDWQPSVALCQYLLDGVSPVIEELRGAGLFAAAADPVSESVKDRLAAFAGRR